MDSSTQYEYHELIDTFQIVRSLKELGVINQLTSQQKSEVASSMKLYQQFEGYSLLSKDYMALNLIYAVVNSFDLFGRIPDLDISRLNDMIVSNYRGDNDDYGFTACTNMAQGYIRFRSRPIEYYSNGEHRYTNVTGSLEDHKHNFMALDALLRMYKLDDFHNPSKLLYVIKNIEGGYNGFYTDQVLYKWLFNVKQNQRFDIEQRKSFEALIADYRRDNRLEHDSTDVDILIGELRLAIQYDSDFMGNKNPSKEKLKDFFGLTSDSWVFSGNFKSDSIYKLIYGLYRRSSADFLLANLGESSISDRQEVPLAVEKSLLAINKYCISKDIIFGDDNKLNSLQEFMMLTSWYLSDLHGQGVYLTMKDAASYFKMPAASIRCYINGKTTNLRNLESINKLKNLVTDLSKSLREGQQELLRQSYNDFYQGNNYKGRMVESNPERSTIKGYPKDWDYPEVLAQHYVELNLRQGGLMPAGVRGELTDDFDILRFRLRHHIDFNKGSKDVLNLILMGTMHSSYTHLEAIKDLGYYKLMREMRDDFEAARPPSFWDSELQDKYIGRLIEFVNEWESTHSSIRFTDSCTGEKVDFIKMYYRGKTYNLQEMLAEGWITEDWVDGIIQDIKQKLESRGLV